MTATAGIQAAAQERLDAVLNSPARGKSRHTQTVDLARRHVGAPNVLVKQVAEVEAPDAVGTFEALVSDFGRDRQGERFAPGAFDRAIAKIRNDGRSVPVLFGHAHGDANSVLGAVPPDGWRVDSRGLHARGWIDTTDPVGAKIHRMLKRASLQWSIGFSLTGGKTTARRDPDGTVVLQEVDEILELSTVPVPANARTRTLGAKADDIVPTHAELIERETALGLSGALARLEHGRRVVAPSLRELHAHEDALRNDGVIAAVERMRYRRTPDLDTAVARMREQTRAEMERVLGGTGTGKAHAPRKPRDEQRARATETTREFELQRALTYDRRTRSAGQQ